MDILLSPRVLPIFLLVGANILMTFAWYGHLKFKTVSFLTVLLISWGIAFFEYCLLIPAHRIGNTVFTVTELKIIQEILTLTIFSMFAISYLGEKIQWNHMAAFLCILAAAAFTFLPKSL
ncbi:MAG: DMT family protein [Limisphaerales bacterium]|jgi:uncharacterized protein (DUF486 family)|nr:DMT family protein [Verrucomicrobiota bacterium]